MLFVRQGVVGVGWVCVVPDVIVLFGKFLLRLCSCVCYVLCLPKLIACSCMFRSVWSSLVEEDLDSKFCCLCYSVMLHICLSLMLVVIFAFYE